MINLTYCSPRCCRKLGWARRRITGHPRAGAEGIFIDVLRNAFAVNGSIPTGHTAHTFLVSWVFPERFAGRYSDRRYWRGHELR
jgi:hypothetical protein